MTEGTTIITVQIAHSSPCQLQLRTWSKFASFTTTSSTPANRNRLLWLQLRPCCSSSVRMVITVDGVITLTHLHPPAVSTYRELQEHMTKVIAVLKQIQPSAVTETVSEIFIRYVTLKCSHFEVCVFWTPVHRSLLEYLQKMTDLLSDLKVRGEAFLSYVSSCTKKVALSSHKFVSDGSTLMVHSVSRAVFCTLLEAKQANKQFTVYVTQSAPDNTGYVIACNSTTRLHDWCTLQRNDVQVAKERWHRVSLDPGCRCRLLHGESGSGYDRRRVGHAQRWHPQQGN